MHPSPDVFPVPGLPVLWDLRSHPQVGLDVS